MRTTIGTDNGGRVIVAPASNGAKLGLGINVNFSGLSVQLNDDQAGALIFAIESALDVMKIRRDQMALMPA